MGNGETGRTETPSRGRSTGARNRKTLTALVGVALSAGGFWYVFRRLDLEELASTAERIRPIFVVASVVLYWSFSIVLRALLVRHVNRGVGPIRTAVAYRYICIGLFANNVLPMRLGEAIRIGGLARASALPVAAVAGAIAVERLLDLSMAALIGVAAIQVAPLPVWTVLVWTAGIAIALLVAALLAGARAPGSRIARFAQPLSTRLNRSRLGSAVVPLFDRFTAGLAMLRSPRELGVGILLIAGVWGGTVAVMVLRLAAFGLPPSLPMALVVLVAITVGVTLPSAPAYVGVYHAMVAGALVTIYDVPEVVAVGFALFCHLVDILPSMVLGAVSLVIEGLSLGEITRASRKVSDQ